jgi:hypothetical protein
MAVHLPQPVYFIPESVLQATLKDYDLNTFVQNLCKLAPAHEVEKVISMYRLGTIGKGERSGAVTFPFIDKVGHVRAIQAKQFDEANHTTSTDFVHSILNRHYMKQGKQLPDWLNNYTKNDLKVSCLFGEHLLQRYPTNPIALVEAPKTAIIATLYFGLPETPKDLLWLGVYNKSSLTLDKCKAIKGRKVVLYPDLNAYNEWELKTQELRTKIPSTKFIVSDMLERNATPEDISKGLDLADYLTRFEINLFRQPKTEPKHIEPVRELHSLTALTMQPQPEPLPRGKNCYSTFTQSEETAVLKEVCRLLNDSGISFSRSGDEIFCSPNDMPATETIFRNVLYAN